MRLKLISAALAVVVAGCTQQAESGKGGGGSWFDKATSAVSSSEWELSETTSGIDGKTLTTTRAYPFTSRNTQFHIEISCNPSSRKAGMTIQSFVGDVESPTEQSAFTALHLENGSMPVARVKFKDGNVFSTPLYTYFALGEHANKATFIASPMLGEALPMLLEIGNGAGTFELAIDRSSEVEQVLAACGQDEASLVHAKAEQQRTQANDVVLEALERSCQMSGNASTYDSAWVEKKLSELSIPPNTASGVEMDCEKSAPEFLAAYNNQIDGHYRTYLNSKKVSDRPDAANGSMPTCSKEEFKAYIKSLGGADMGAADFAFQLASQPPECDQRTTSTNSIDLDNASIAAMEAAASAADGAAENSER